MLIVGCGDIGLRVATPLFASGRRVRALVRSEARALTLRAQSLDARVHDLDAAPATCHDTPLIFYFAPPPTQGDTDPRLRDFLRGVTPTSRIVYISTSGVYGDCEGRWIDEDEPLKPSSDRARRRLDAERALSEWGGDFVTLRVPGIYGPGRLPVERLHKRLPVVRADESPFTNRIHSDDLARAALHAAAYGQRGQAINVSDGHPTTMCDYFVRCAKQLGLPSPPQISLAEAQRAFTPAMWSFMEESKRLKTDRLRDALHFVPRYPTLADGLPHCSAN